MPSLEDYVHARLDVLARLRQGASQSELTYYAGVEDSYRRLLEAPQGESSTLKHRLSRILEMIARLEYEMRQPQLGQYWHTWAREELALLRGRAVQLAGTAGLTFDDAAITLTDDDYRLQDLRESLETRLEEIESLSGLIRSKIEKSGTSAACQRLEEIGEEKAQIEQQLRSIMQNNKSYSR